MTTSYILEQQEELKKNKAMMRAAEGKPKDQAVAIAMKTSKGMKDGGSVSNGQLKVKVKKMRTRGTGAATKGLDYYERV